MSENELYAERSLVMYKLCFAARAKKDVALWSEDVMGRSATAHFREFCEECEGRIVSIPRTEKFIVVIESRDKRRGVLAQCRSGKAGEEGQVVNTATSEVEHQYGRASAPMFQSRVYLWLPPYKAKYALACVEHVNGAAGDTVLLKGFEKHLLGKDVVVQREQVMIAEAMNELASLERIEYRTYLNGPDLEDNVRGAQRGSDYLSITLKHGRANPFPWDWLSSIRQDRRCVREMFGMAGDLVDPDNPNASLHVTVKDHNGAQKTFAVGESLDFPLREVLNPYGSPPLLDGEFVSRCAELCEDAAGRMGREA